MLFQNSCVAPFGMTAMVSFFFALLPGVQAISKVRTSNNTSNLRMMFSCKSLFHAAAQRRKEEVRCAAAPPRELLIRLTNHRISQAAHPLDQHLHLIAGLQKHRRITRE